MLQHQDINVGPASYKHLKPDQLLITKIFYTIQGEGPLSGHPAVFIRLAGCNRGQKYDMGCAFCDTDFRFSNGRVMTYDEIINIVYDVHKSEQEIQIVMTGGEPMMQDNIVGFISHLKRIGLDRVQIESNGDRLARDWLAWGSMTDSVTLVVSPKAGRDGYKVLSDSVFNRADALKFLISADPDSPYHDVPDWAFRFRNPVYLQPMMVYRKQTLPLEPASLWGGDSAIDHQLTARNFERVSQLVMEYDFFVSIQTHLLLQVE